MRNGPESFRITVQPGLATTALVYQADLTPVGAVLLLAHGAGADQHSSWIVGFARALSELGVDVVTFNFLYTESHRRAPDRRPLLDACYRAVIDAVQQHVKRAAESLFIGGKSMGGRIATHVAADDPNLEVKGLVLLGYPLHPPGRPHEPRDAHLPAVGRPMLFVQGSRDVFGTARELEPVLSRIVPGPTLHVVDGGDHSFKVTTNASRQAAVFKDVQQTIVGWLERTTAVAS